MLLSQEELIVPSMPLHLSCCEENVVLRNKVAELETELSSLKAEHECEIATFQLRIQELEDSKAKNSTNSSKPPSTNGYEKPAPKSQRKKSGKKVGGQEGHEGQTLEMTPYPDEVVEHTIDTCTQCGANLEVEEVITHECRQEIEMPATPVVTIEHQAQVKLCPKCLMLNTATFPDNIAQPIQYGQRLKAISIYLSQYQFISYDRLAQYFHDCHGVSISQGTLVNFNYKGAESFVPTIEYIKTQIINSDVANADESSMKINGKNNWLHVASTPEYTYYEIHANRGKIAMEAIGILPNFNGILVHDHWKVYFNYGVANSLCNAHHLRELTFATERYEQCWSDQLIDCLLDIKRCIDEAKAQGETQLSSLQLERFSEKYSRILREGKSELPTLPQTDSPPRKNAKQHKIKNLWDRLRDFKKETLLFMYDFRVPFTNNLPEGDIRMCKNKAKISGSFRSVKGANTFATTRSYISTVKKQDGNVLDEIENALNGVPFLMGQFNGGTTYAMSV